MYVKGQYKTERIKREFTIIRLCNRWKILDLMPKRNVSSVWWPAVKNNPNVANACRKRRLKWAPSAWGYNWATRAPEGI
jgi:hypothetical protein